MAFFTCPLSASIYCTPAEIAAALQVNDGQQGHSGLAGGRQVSEMVWLWRVYVCLCLPEPSMLPGVPAFAPALPLLAFCARRPLVVYTLTVWFLRHSSILWAIVIHCCFGLLNQGALGRLFARNMEQRASTKLARQMPAHICLYVLGEGTRSHGSELATKGASPPPPVTFERLLVCNVRYCCVLGIQGALRFIL